MTPSLPITRPLAAPDTQRPRRLPFITARRTWVTTSRGHRVMVRPIAPTDTALLSDLLSQISEHSCQMRYFRPRLHAEAIRRETLRVISSDPLCRLVLLAIIATAEGEQAIGVAEVAVDQSDPAQAEVAVLIRDDYQREGLGTALVRQLVQSATRRGITTLRAHILLENRPIFALIQRLGLPYRTELRCGEALLLLDLTH